MSLTVDLSSPTTSKHGLHQNISPSSPSGINVLIVGAGPVGVYTALCCWRKGHNVRIIERSPVARTQGDFFTITQQIISHIQTWPDLVEENERIAVDPWVLYSKINGDVISGPEAFNWKPRTAAVVQDDQQGETPRRMYRHHRPKFLQMLISQLERVGIKIEYGCRVTEYYENKGVGGVVLDDGRKMEADVVVAADGIGTKSHKLVNNHDVRARSSGWASFRAAFPVERIAEDKELDEGLAILDNGHPLVRMMHGPGVHMIILRTNDIVSWGIMHKDDGGAQESWQQTVKVDTVLDCLSKVPDVPDFVKRLIKATPEDGIVDWKLMLRNPQPIITSPLGRLVQAGDAAHTYLPSSGSGANQGIEDAIYLATCLELGGKENVQWATRVHNKLRFERVSCCQKVGFINFARRNNKDAQAVSRDPSKIKTEQGQWMWRHEPEKYAYDNYHPALEHLQNGAEFANTNIPRGHVHEDWTVDELMAKIEKGEPIEFDGDWS
ncbi:hypothetical protein PFICI_10399 [Pestalotiopsis fici W106-1]|uniref:FAD-binding domain-containing protein n=1 Tax=Pestalotiopsis fici (strain W106-1 / CGMCC3.15140) TaxID=1229662 RepID=W3WZ02_PESFW|nr:uncharacterized protein PFICI_10399 [Pestalotiopsis fici W106-1]ETS78337.1 hypothetical protein PFICI_10399 [Pestalotiopsis fici W106-1]